MTLIPVWSSNGFRTASQLVSSWPDQTPRKCTVPAFCDDPVPHATAVNIATIDRVRLRLYHFERIFKSPIRCRTDDFPAFETSILFTSPDLANRAFPSRRFYARRPTTSFGLRDASEVEPRTTRLVLRGAGETTVPPFMRSIRRRAARRPFSTMG